MKRSVAKEKAKAALRLLTPPIVWRLTRGLRARGRLEGPLVSWDAAAARATGWNSPAIAEKALAAALQVRDGVAAFERDSRPYDRIIYSPAVLAALLLAAARHRALNVIDFGGGLGSNYYQHRKLLQALPGPPMNWNVIERAPLAKVGAAQFQTSELRFHADLAEVRADDAVLLFTGSLQYVADAFGLLERAIRDIDIVAIDRLYLSDAPAHAAYVQHLDPKEFGMVTLPMWVFAKAELIGWFTARGFVLVEHFTLVRERKKEFCGLLFMRA